jgi:hypothetical protein
VSRKEIIGLDLFAMARGLSPFQSDEMVTDATVTRVKCAALGKRTGSNFNAHTIVVGIPKQLEAETVGSD